MREPMTDPAEILRAALAETDEHERKQALAWAVRALIEHTGLEPSEAGQVLAALGWRESLEPLFRGAWLAEKVARDMGAFKRGTLKEIWAMQAAIWADASGQPDYGYDEFRAAYAAWKKRTGGGGIGRNLTRARPKKSLGK